MKKRFINMLILVLLFILIIFTAFTVGKYTILKEQQETKKVVSNQNTMKETNLIDKEILIKKLNDENKLMVLSGETEIQARYSNKVISDEDVNLKWVKEWINNANSKDLSVNALYTYQFHYDLTDFNLEVVGDEVNIYISRNRLRCQVELLENQSFYADRVGILESKFTAQEINSLNARTKALVLNKIQSDKLLRDRAMENVKKDIEKLLNVKCNFTVAEFDVVEYDDGIILKIN